MHAVARIVSGVVLVLVARTQQANPWTTASPSYLEYVGLMWDGSWYREIAEQGYPEQLPRGEDGRVLQNAWAFFPLFPLVVRALMSLTGGSWQVVAPVTSLVAGTAAMLVVHRVVAQVTRPGSAVPLLTVVLLTSSPASPVLQVAYTESLALGLLAAVLWCLLTHRYLLGVPVVLGLGLTRAVALPLVAVVLIHAVARSRGRVAWLPGEQGRLTALGVAAALAGLAWPAVTAVVTGEPRAYAMTQAAWRGRGEVLPVVPWLDVAMWLGGGLGVVLLVLLMVLVVLALTTTSARRLGPELCAWVAAYAAYLVVVTEPGTSLVRFGLLAFPVAAMAAPLVAGPDGRRPRVARLTAAVLLGIAAQVAWVVLLWRLVGPSGWPP